MSARASARHARDGDEASDPSSSRSRRVENTRRGSWFRWQKWVRRHRNAELGGDTGCAGKIAAGCRVHGCSSLTMWVASVGRTRPDRLSKSFNRKVCGGRSQLEESRGTFDTGAAERDERTARETVHLAWTTGRTESGREGTLRWLSSTTEGASDRRGSHLNRAFLRRSFGQAGQRRATLFTERLRRERTVALEPFGRARAVTGSVRDGRQTAKAPPAERRGGSAWRRAHSRRVAAT
jgi:hypothetical protein